MEASQRSSRRQKWQYPSTPRSVHFPRRQSCRRKASDLETTSSKWRVEAEMLRAECNLLRIEKEVAVKKVERRREKIENTLRSTIDVLLSGRGKIFEGKNARLVMDQQINELLEKLQKFTRKSRDKDLEFKNYSNFDKQAHFLKSRLKKFDKISDEICSRKIGEMTEASFSIKQHHSCLSHNDTNIQILRRRMEALCRGFLLERIIKEYDKMHSKANSCDTGSLSSPKQIVLPDKESQPCEKTCMGHCKAIVRKLVDQVRVETEQWSQMQEMLYQVKDEMEELQTSRDYWEKWARNSDRHIETLNSDAQEWRQKALCSAQKVKELSGEVSVLKAEIEKMRKKLNLQNPSSEISEEPKPETILGILVRRLKENPHGRSKQNQAFMEERSRRRRTNSACYAEFAAQERLPLQEIGKESPVIRQKIKFIPPFAQYKENGA